MSQGLDMREGWETAPVRFVVLTEDGVTTGHGTLTAQSDGGAMTLQTTEPIPTGGVIELTVQRSEA